MAVFLKLKEDLDKALKEKDELTVSTLRFALSNLHNARIAKGADLSDEEIISEISKDAKRHRESIEAYKAASRSDLVEKETAELGILQRYLPQQLSEEELSRMVDEAISALGAKGAADTGRVVGAVMSGAGAKADGARVAQIAQVKLANV